MPETKIQTVVLLSDDAAHTAAIKSTLREINPLTRFIELSDTATVLDYVNDAQLISFTPDLVIVDMDLQLFVGKSPLYLLHCFFSSLGNTILLPARENDHRCLLYSMLYGFRLLYKPASTGNYKHNFAAMLPDDLQIQVY